MTAKESETLAARIEFLSHQIAGDVRENPDGEHGWLVRVEFRDAWLEFVFDHSAGSATDLRGRKPDESLVVSALWARTTKVRGGESAFYETFKRSKESRALWTEWKRCADWCTMVFGEGFGT
jgi:hypothetical protein